MTRPVSFIAAVAAGLCPASIALGQTFMGLGDLAGGEYRSSAWGVVSAYGTAVAVGDSDSLLGHPEAFRWTQPTDMEGLGFLTRGLNVSSATAVSADGSVIVGWSIPPTWPWFSQAVRWVNDQITALDCLPGDDGGKATAVSSDGLFIVGWSEGPGTPTTRKEAILWHPMGFSPLGFIGNDNRSVAHGVYWSGTAITVVGWSGTADASRCEAFRLELPGSPQGLGFLPGADESTATAISPDGVVIVGYSGSEACRWTEDGGSWPINGLGFFEGGESVAWAVANPGGEPVIVGTSDTNPDPEITDRRAFIWDPTNKMRHLKDVLVNAGVPNLTDWTLVEATGISEDGTIVVGNGINPSRNEEAWIASLLAPINDNWFTPLDIGPGTWIGSLEFSTVDGSNSC